MFYLGIRGAASCHKPALRVDRTRSPDRFSSRASAAGSRPAMILPLDAARGAMARPDPLQSLPMALRTGRTANPVWGTSWSKSVPHSDRVSGRQSSAYRGQAPRVTPGETGDRGSRCLVQAACRTRCACSARGRDDVAGTWLPAARDRRIGIPHCGLGTGIGTRRQQLNQGAAPG